MDRDIIQFNRLYRELDEIYHIYAKEHGLSDSALWILYSLVESNTRMTQKDMCRLWHRPPQTINSALKRLEAQEMLRLIPAADSQKTKEIVLTDSGRDLVSRIILPVFQAETRALRCMSIEERTLLLSMTAKYVDHLKEEI
ncbi:MAG TPA: MarR family transcriptional regulator [Candidatus Fimisoma avicola]|uniref:MarR family transcriptional regulator n=1 Tax=Candidatus Fimisoma avicola TaxID=2840826 RepID=A0A9D1L909_9FIRM|nr:MarR family transcriptional regulator [Candidatus Fimisoma avicola]